MQKKWWLIAIITILLGLTYPLVFKKPTPTAIIGGKTINVELAKTPEDLQKGLMNRNFLAPNSGMLFIFPHSDIWPFWMKNTLIPLDIIWLAPSKVEGIKTIVDMTTLNPPTDINSNTNIPEYSPKSPANYILEVNAGFIKENNLKIGDKVEIKDLSI